MAPSNWQRCRYCHKNIFQVKLMENLIEVLCDSCGNEFSIRPKFYRREPR